MKSIILVIAILAFATLAIAQVPADSLAPLDTTGIMAGTPTKVGGWLLGAIQIAGAAVAAFLTARIGGMKNADKTPKFPWFTGSVAASLVVVVTMLMTGLAAIITEKVGLETGLSFSWRAFAGFVGVTLWFHIRKPRISTTFGPPAPPKP
jgi:hypothetical protein